jgi:nitrous oxidase accessory protein NosD
MDRQAAFAVTVFVIASIVLFILGNPPTAQDTADDCLMSLDLETGEPMNPHCSLPASAPVSATAVMAHLHTLDASCPAPTVKQGSQCVLRSDVVLDATLDLDALTHLNCRGHKILPSSTSGTGVVRSTPELAILLNGAYGSTIQNCIIGDATKPFDCGIMIAKSKTSTGLKVLNNEISSRAAGVQVLESDSTHISGNTFESIGGCSVGIAVQYDSDSNQITDNTVIGSSGTSGGPVRVAPGTDDPMLGCPSNPVFVSGAILPFPLINARVGNALIQFRNAPNIGLTGQTELSSDGNVIESNTIMQVGSSAGKQHLGITLAEDATGTLIENNIVSGGQRGIQGVGVTLSIMIPGTCTFDPSRYCLSNADCFISGVDTAPKGTCTGVTSTTARRTSRGTRIEHNQLTGSFNDRAISVIGQINSTVIGNTILATAPFGISVSNEFIQTGIVKNNIVDGPSTALRLQQGSGVMCSPAECFRARYRRTTSSTTS